ncbi:MAG: hypothetical protein WBP63_11350, partial [Silvibacterium sp.]
SQSTTVPRAIPQRNASDSVIASWILVIATLWCVCWFVHAWHYWEDDAYIHLEFARNIVEGHGYSFNGLLVNGDTSPLWVLLLAAMHSVVPNWLVAGKILTALGAIFAVAGTYFFAKHLTKNLDNNKTFAAAMVLLLVTNPYFCYWSFSGMEALTATGLAFWGALVAVRETPTWASFFAGCFLAGVAPVLRPEMLVFTGLVCLLLLWQWLRLPGDTFSGTKMLALLAGLILVAAPLAAWSAYALHAFGHIVPNTNAAKRAGPGQSVVKRLLNVYGLGFPLILAEIAGLAIFAAVRPAAIKKDSGERNLLGILPAATWIFVVWSLVATVFYIVDHTYVQTRYIFVTAPELMLAMLVFNYQRLPRLAYRVSLAGALLAAVVVSVIATWPLVRNKGVEDQKIAEMAAFVHNDLPPTDALAIYSIGEMAFDSQHPLIDTGGITRPDLIRYLNDHHGKTVEWAQAQGAKYYDSYEQPAPGAVLVFSVTVPNIGWSLHHRSYSRINTLRIWKLPTSPEAVTSSKL